MRFDTIFFRLVGNNAFCALISLCYANSLTLPLHWQLEMQNIKFASFLCIWEGTVGYPRMCQHIA